MYNGSSHSKQHTRTGGQPLTACLTRSTRVTMDATIARPHSPTPHASATASTSAYMPSNDCARRNTTCKSGTSARNRSMEATIDDELIAHTLHRSCAMTTLTPSSRSITSSMLYILVPSLLH